MAAVFVSKFMDKAGAQALAAVLRASFSERYEIFVSRDPSEDLDESWYVEIRSSL